MTRNDILLKLKEYPDIEQEVSEFIDDIESRINDAVGKLDSVKSISDLDLVDDCKTILDSLSGDLY